MGMNTDDSWAGPSDQNAKTYVNSIVRYGLEIFWLNLNLEMGQGFINCIWQDASAEGKPDSRQSGPLSGFQALQKAAGNEAAAHVIMSFGARSTILDYDGWTEAVRSMIKGNWNNSYWFYTHPTGDGTAEFSPPTKNIPHHQLPALRKALDGHAFAADVDADRDLGKKLNVSVLPALFVNGKHVRFPYGVVELSELIAEALAQRN